MIEETLKGLRNLRRFLEDKEWDDDTVAPYINVVIKAEVLLKKNVRCKECKYWKDKVKRDEYPSWLPCMAIETAPEFYCAKGERNV